MAEISLECINCGSLLLIWNGSWHCGNCGTTYPIEDRVHRFLPECLTPEEKKVAQCYSFLWEKISTMKYSTERIRHRHATYALWFGLETAGDWQHLLEGKIVMDAGTGCGMAEHLFIDYPEILYGIDLSEGIKVAAQYWRDRQNFVPIQASIFHLPIPENYLDVILSFGVLHHTPDTRSALEACIKKLKPGGKILFYIYRKKSATREFSDDYIRARLADLSPEEAWQALEPITRLGEALSRIPVKISVPVDVPELNMKAGDYTVYELIQWHLLACFWSPAYSLAENLRVNLDWYLPRYAHRHSPEEVWQWLRDMGLKAERFRATDSGIAVFARKMTGKVQ